MAENENDEQGFVVRDRRRFTGEGEIRSETASPGGDVASEGEGVPPPGAAQAAQDAMRDGPRGPGPDEARGQGGSHPIDFTTFVFSLGSSALMHLGDAPHPETGQTHQDLALARETIDLLAMLREKTRGNLSQEEERFLGSLLYDLRMRFIAAAKK